MAQGKFPGSAPTGHAEANSDKQNMSKGNMPPPNFAPGSINVVTEDRPNAMPPSNADKRRSPQGTR